MSKAAMFLMSCLILNTEVSAADEMRVRVNLDSRTSEQDGRLAENLMNSFFLAGVSPRVQYNETGTIETTSIGIDQMRCIYEGLVDAETHPSKTLLNTNYKCSWVDSYAQVNRLTPGESFHVANVVEKVVKAKSELVGATAFFIEQINCTGVWNAFPIDIGGTRDYSCDFDVQVFYEGE